MKDGLVVEQGEARQIVTEPYHAYTRQLMEAVPAFSSHRLRPSRLPSAPVSGRRPDGRPPTLAVENVSVRFISRSWGRRTNTDAVKSVSFDIVAGETLAVVGESGSGKSSLARVVTRLIKPSEGDVRFEGRSIIALRGLALRELYRSVQFVHQNPFSSLDPRFSVQQIVEEPLRGFGIGDRRLRRQRVLELLTQVALPASFVERYPQELSGGQRQRVAIARALAGNPRLVVLDEPVSALDVSVQAQILRLLVDLQAELGLSYLFITHDLAVVRLIADRVLVMRNGEAKEIGPVEQIFARPAHAYTHELLSAIPKLPS